MIIKDHGLIGIEYEGDKFKYTHAQDIDVTKTEIEKLRSVSKDGFSQDRTMRHVGRIPAIEYLKHPEWNHAPELLIKWLQSDEGKQYQVHKINTGRSGKVVVK